MGFEKKKNFEIVKFKNENQAIILMKLYKKLRNEIDQ
jgi:hypothetical protein